MIIKNNLSWFTPDKINKKYIISSRVRITRNIVDYKFPEKLNQNEKNKISGLILDACSKEKILDDFTVLYLDKLSKHEKKILFEQNLLSNQLVKSDSGIILLSNDYKTSISINEEEHLRVQTLETGEDLISSFQNAISIIDKIENHLDFSFSEEFGYLTTCPTNVGTGLKISVMCHLPLLANRNTKDAIIETKNKNDLIIRGFYGENSAPVGNIFQISNGITLGQNEEGIINNFLSNINIITDKEKELRNPKNENQRKFLKDRVFRSKGVIENGLFIDFKESLYILSDILLGIDQGMIKGLKDKDIYKLLFEIQPFHLIDKYKLYENNFPNELIMELRAKHLKESLKF